MRFAGRFQPDQALPALLFVSAWVVAAMLAELPAAADVTHVVKRGHTLETIASHYHVSIRSIVDANHLKIGDPLRPGQTLVIPGVDGPDPSGPSDTNEPTSSREGQHAGQSRRGSEASAGLGDFAAPRGPFDRDVIHAARPEEAFRIRVKDAHGRIPANALLEFEQMMRQGLPPKAATHPPDPRLVALIGMVSNHFGGRTLEIVSGYRAYKPTQYTPQSRHNYGRALDFRIRGVPNEVLRDFCRTLRNTGCGYYPNSTFVHMDVRDAKAYWVDLSHPGEPPNYEHLGTGADEGTSDVTTDSH